MGNLELPESLAGLFHVLTGLEWPKMDTDKMYQLAQVYRDTASDLRDVVPDQLARSTQGLARSLQAGATDPLIHAMRQFVDQDPGYLGKLADNADSIADFVRISSANAERAKWMIIGTLVELAAEIAYAIAMAPFTFGASLAELPGLYALGRVTLRHLFTTLIRSILEQAVLGAAIFGAMDLIIQRIQIGQGHRDKIDTNLTLQTAALGGVTGAVSPVTGVIGGGLGAKLDGALTHTGAGFGAKIGGFTAHQGLDMGMDFAGGMLANGLYNLAFSDDHEFTATWGNGTAGLFGGRLKAGAGAVGKGLNSLRGGEQPKPGDPDLAPTPESGPSSDSVPTHEPDSAPDPTPTPHPSPLPGRTPIQHDVIDPGDRPGAPGGRPRTGEDSHEIPGADRRTGPGDDGGAGPEPRVPPPVPVRTYSGDVGAPTPGRPSKPSRPGEQDTPGGQGTPGEPGEQGTSDEYGDPGRPGGPGGPGGPDGPDGSGGPGEQGRPGEQDTPAERGAPGHRKGPPAPDGEPPGVQLHQRTVGSPSAPPGGIEVTPGGAPGADRGDAGRPPDADDPVPGTPGGSVADLVANALLGRGSQ